MSSYRHSDRLSRRDLAVIGVGLLGLTLILALPAALLIAAEIGPVQMLAIQWGSAAALYGAAAAVKRITAR